MMVSLEAQGPPSEFQKGMDGSTPGGRSSWSAKGIGFGRCDAPREDAAGPHRRGPRRTRGIREHPEVRREGCQFGRSLLGSTALRHPASISRNRRVLSGAVAHGTCDRACGTGLSTGPAVP